LSVNSVGKKIADILSEKLFVEEFLLSTNDKQPYLLIFLILPILLTNG